MTRIVHMIGNAHLDPVWLWGWQAGADEVTATFRSAADRCDEYREFVFTAGEAWRYDIVERHDPELFTRIEKLVADGRWSVVGGQWVQPDCNLPTGTALRRQLGRGQSYFADRFGLRCTVGFNPDSFGHPNTLPDLLAEEGLTAYAYHRPSTAQLSLPAQLVRWRGPAGGEVLAFRISPSYVTRATDLAGQLEIVLETMDDDATDTMCFYGVGNHGGGPTKAQIEWILEHRTSFADVELRFSSMDAYFAAVAPVAPSLPMVVDELQHVFPGCYSAMHDVKQRQRHTEHLLEQAERLSSALGGDAATDERLAAAWDDVLFTAFHDILAGTCVASAWGSVAAQQGRARIVAEEVAYTLTRQGARTLPPSEHPQIVAFNDADTTWRGLLEIEPWIDFDDWGSRWISTAAGKPLPYQLVDAEADVFMTRVLVPVEIAPRSFETVLIQPSNEPTPTPEPIPGAVSVTQTSISSGDVRIELGAGGIARIVATGNDLLGAAGASLHLREDESDTWTMDSDRFDGPIVQVLSGLDWSIEEEGPLRGRVRGVGLLGHSPLEIAVSLDHEGRIDIELAVTMTGRFEALQLALDLPAAPMMHLDGVPGGACARTLGPTEWPVQGWSRLTFAERDVALLTADAYSASADERTWQWTLLRTPRMAWPPLPSDRKAAVRHTDQGEHRYSFRLLTAPSLPADELDRLARAQQQPPISFSRYELVSRPPWGGVPPRKLWTEGERRNELRG